MSDDQYEPESSGEQEQQRPSEPSGGAGKKRPRRGRNEGSVYRRGGAGPWFASLSLPGGRRKTISAPTKKEALAKLRQAQLDLQAGRLAATPDQTVEQLLRSWLEHIVRPNRRPRTYESYRSMIERHILPTLGAITLRRLEPRQIQALYTKLLTTPPPPAKGNRAMRPTAGPGGLSPRTVRYAHTLLKAALAQAVAWGLLASNPAERVRPPDPAPRAVEPLTLEQARALLVAARGHRLERLLALALATGLRLGELVGLRWEDVDLDGATLTVRRAIQRVDGRLTADRPKSERGRRRLALPATIVGVLRRQREHVAAERAMVADRWREHDLVFPSAVGTPLEPRKVITLFKRVLAAAGLPETVRFHDLRHSCAAILIAIRAGPREIMGILGHSSINVTFDIYGHILGEVARESAEQMDATLRQLGVGDKAETESDSVPREVDDTADSAPPGTAESQSDG
jgi:integrase